MGAKTSIEWSDATWSPLRVRVRPDARLVAKSKGYNSLVHIAGKMAGHVGQHCEHVSDGCKHCYSGTWQARCLTVNGTGLPFDRRSRDLIEPFVDEKILAQPLKWRTPKKIFVANQSDLFGEWYTDEQIDHVFAVMALCPQHTFQCLTKRPERMLRYLDRGRPLGFGSDVRWPSVDLDNLDRPWPLDNCWAGVSVEDQKTADTRIPLLLRTPAAIRFVSYEPALGPVDFSRWLDADCCPDCGADDYSITPYNFGQDPETGYYDEGVRAKCRKCGCSAEIEDFIPKSTGPFIDQIIVGGESGPGARPFYVEWARQAIQQCRAAGVAAFFKQAGANVYDSLNSAGWPLTIQQHKGRYLLQDRKGGDLTELPPEIRIREFPEVRR